MIGYDFFFRNSYHQSQTLKTALYVYPGLVDSRRITLLCKAVSGMIVTQNRLFPDPFCFSGIRDYHPSDPMHTINWKASAKGQGLLVNQHDSTTSIRMRIILDTEDSGILRQEELTEEGIRIAASLSSRIVKERMELTVTGNGMNTICLKEGAGQIQTLFQELSRINIRKPVKRLTEELKGEREHLQSDIIYVIVSKNQDSETVRGVASMAEKGSRILWVIPLRSSAEYTAGTIKGVNIFKWEMNAS